MPTRRAIAAAPASIDTAELAAVKRRARAAYLDAKRKGAAPPTLLDRWHSDTLLATNGAPQTVAARMWSRSEWLYRLLLDRQRWMAERDAEGKIIG